MNLLNRLSLKNRLLFVVFIAIFVCSITALSVSLYFTKKELHHGIVEKSQAIHDRLDAVTDFIANQGGLAPVIETMKAKYKTHDLITKEDKEIVLKQVPIVGAMKIGLKNAEHDNYTFQIFSDEPRNEGNKSTSEQLAIFKKFEENPHLAEQVVESDQFVTVYRPVRLTESQGCFNCHGDPAHSPWGNGRDILGYKMENWKEGKLHGVFGIKTDIAKVLKEDSDKTLFSSTTILIFLIIVGGSGSMLIAHLMIRGPIANLNTVANQLSASGSLVSSASSQIASSSEELSQASTEQAASLQETSASIEEISSMINNNSENAKQATNISAQSLMTAEKGKVVVNHMTTAIRDIDVSNEGISEQINETNKEIENIVKIINDIGNKTKVINDIVFQTKLLSFNASVEAARAGEHGKGFAVVAEEVGNLAAMSGNAAHEISQMLNGSIKSVEDIVKKSKESIGRLISESKSKVEVGAQVALQCETVFNEILQNISHVSKMVNEISEASQEQAQGVSEVNKAIAQLDQVTHQNTSNASQSSSAAGSLSMQAQELNSLVQTLAQTINGKTLERREATFVHQEIVSKKNEFMTVEKDVGPMDFNKAIQVHADWKQKLSKYIQKPDGSLKSEDVCLDNKCILGKWIYGEGTHCSHLSEYQKLKDSHAKFHKEASEIIKRVNMGVNVSEEIMLGSSSPFTNASKEVASLLLALKGKMAKNSEVSATKEVRPKTLESSPTNSVPTHNDSRFEDV
jgi:methyl-accepting chemotaxis protein